MKSFLFDLDGTLVDSMHVWDDIGEAFLKQHNIEIPNSIHEIISSMSFAQSAAYFIELGNLSMSVKEVCDIFYDMVKIRYQEDILTKPYVNAFLKQCKQQNMKMGILTALDEKIAHMCLKRNKIDTYFDFILTCDVFGKGKDDITIFQEGARRLQASSEHIVVFEDALYCMKTAHEAGMQVIGVYDDTQVIHQNDIDTYCTRFIHSFEELLQEEEL